MAEDQPHLCIQMSESSANGIPSGTQSTPDLAGKAGSVLTFHNIYYRVKTKTGFLCFGKTTMKEVLRDVKYVFKHLFGVCVNFISVWRVDFTHVTEPFSTTRRSRFTKIICMWGCFVCCPQSLGWACTSESSPPLALGVQPSWLLSALGTPASSARSTLPGNPPTEPGCLAEIPTACPPYPSLRRPWEGLVF